MYSTNVQVHSPTTISESSARNFRHEAPSKNGIAASRLLKEWQEMAMITGSQTIGTRYHGVFEKNSKN